MAVPEEARPDEVHSLDVLDAFVPADREQESLEFVEALEGFVFIEVVFAGEGAQDVHLHLLDCFRRKFLVQDFVVLFQEEGVGGGFELLQEGNDVDAFL